MRFPVCMLMVTVVVASSNLLDPRVPMAAERQHIPVTPRSPALRPDATIEQVRITETRKGEKLWDVEADKVEVFEDRGIAVFRHVTHPVRIVIYNGEETLTALAERAVVDLKTKDLQLIGDVRSESSQGTKVFTERLNWSTKSQKISTKAAVVIEKEGFRIKGKGMVADAVLEQMTIHERIASQITLSRKQEQHQ